MKKTLLFALILLIFGGALFGIAIAASGGFHFEKSFITRTVFADKDFSSISISTDTANVKLLPATDGKCKAVLYEKKNIPHTVEVKDDTLVITSGERRWFDYIFSFGKPSIELYLPKAEYDVLNAEANTGDITVEKTFTFENASIEADTGDIILNASVNGQITLETDTGDITVDKVQGYLLHATTDTGDITLTDVSATGGVDIETDTGRISVDTLAAKSLITKGDTARQSLNNLTVQNGISIQNGTGDVRIENTTADSLMLSLSTGDATIKNSVFTSTLDARASTGDIIFSRSDAKQITVHTSTGDIKGTLLTGKIFDAKANTGKVRVPESITTEERCKLKTSTGNITITIAP